MTDCVMTDAACAHLQKILAKHPAGSVLCLTIQKYGCSGYGFLPSVKQAAPADYVQLTPHADMSLFVDPRYVKYMQDMTIDLVEKELGQRQLKFINPKLEDECGCGESFSLPEED